MLRNLLWSGLYAGLAAGAALIARLIAKRVWRAATGVDPPEKKEKKQ